MTTEHNSSDHKNILKGLGSSDSNKVIDAIEELRASGQSTDIPVLLELLHSSQNSEIKSKIIDLFSNLKESDAIPYIVEAIHNQRYAAESKDLVSCCWENGLDYSNYLPLFVDLLIEGDFLIAFESYTVITNMTATISQVKIDLEIEKLDKAMKTATDERKALILDVIDFLPSIGL